MLKASCVFAWFPEEAENAGLVKDNWVLLYSRPMSRWVTYLPHDSPTTPKRILLPTSLPAEKVDAVAKSNGHLLITGKTGTGKDELAKYIWYRSKRYGQVFTAKPRTTLLSSTDRNNRDENVLPFKGGDRLFRSINCAAVNPQLLLSELFGNVKGAFTGATRDRSGILSWMDGGTIVLEDIGVLPPDAQASLLRFIHTGKIQKIGSDRVEPRIDVRVIATTNVTTTDDSNLRQDLRQSFRYRLQLPSLNERGEDVPDLLTEFMRSHGVFHSISVRWLMEMMCGKWPGNIRQLLECCEALRDHETAELERGCSAGIDIPPSRRIINEQTWAVAVGEWEPSNDRRGTEITYFEIVQYLLQLLEERQPSVLTKALRDPLIRTTLKILDSLSWGLDHEEPYGIHIPLSSLITDSVRCAKIGRDSFPYPECGVLTYLHFILNGGRDPHEFFAGEWFTPKDSDTFYAWMTEQGFSDGSKRDFNAAIEKLPSVGPEIEPLRATAIILPKQESIVPPNAKPTRELPTRMTKPRAQKGKLVLKGFDPKKQKFLLFVNGRECAIVEAQMMKIFAFAIAKKCAKGKEFPGLRQDKETSLGYKLFQALAVKPINKILIEARKGLCGLSVESSTNVQGYRESVIKKMRPDDGVKMDSGEYSPAYELDWMKDDIDLTQLVDYISQPHSPVSPKFKTLSKIYLSLR